jgi:plastocyanin
MRRLLLASVVAVSGALLGSLTAAAATSSARIVNCPPAFGCFTPNPIRITVGDRVSWTNSAGVTHTSTSDTGAWDTGTIAPGTTSSAVLFTTAGTFAYHCAIHPSMTGSVIVSAAMATAPAPTSPPVRRLASGGGGPQLPIAAVLLLLGLGLLAARGVRRYRTQGLDKHVDKLPHE